MADSAAPDLPDDAKAHALRVIAEDEDLVRFTFFRFGPDDRALIPLAQENVRAAAAYAADRPNRR
jgi:hypothetical protein